MEGKGIGDLNKLDSVELVERAKTGNQECVEVLFLRYRPRLLRMATRSVGHSQLSCELSDIVQSTLRRALLQWDGFEPRHERAIAAWFSVILSNTVASLQRRDGAAKRCGGVTLVGLDANGVPADSYAIHGALVDDLAQDELAARVWSSLSEEELELVRPRLEDRMEWGGVAESAGLLNAECARKKYGRLISRLRQQLLQEEI